MLLSHALTDTSLSLTTQAPQRIGLVAGWGRFPIVVAESLKSAGHQVFCIGLANHADPVLAKVCDDYLPCGVAKLGKQIRYFRRNGVTQATLAGKLFKHRLIFGRFGWLPLLPDFRTVRTFVPFFITRSKRLNDDSILTAIVEEFARDGIQLMPATDLAPELLVKLGTLTRREPTTAEKEDITYGFQVAKDLGRLDIGQSVIVKRGSVIAVEAVEGTDLCIRRAGELVKQGGFVVVKTAKPQQDMRFDVPTIGVGTLETLHAAGGKVLAVEADRTIVVDQAEVIAMANRLGMTIVAVNES